MSAGTWAVVPVKETHEAKQRLADAMSPPFRQRLAVAMLEDVLSALAASAGLSGIAVVTLDPQARELARRFDARVLADGAREGQTGAVSAAARLLRAEHRHGMLAIPGDVPLVTPEEIAKLLAAHDRDPDFVIAPAHDSRGSNAILCVPPDGVPLKFGNDSFLPHLAAARDAGLEPKIVRLPRIGLDIDNPEDLAAFARQPSPTRAYVLLQEIGFVS